MLEAGLREAYFGNMLKSNQNLFTEYVEHFVGPQGELWIVFKDAGASLRGYLYEAVNSDDFVVYQHSWLWTKIRVSLKRWAGLSIASSEEESPARESSKDATIGHQLLGMILRQVCYTPVSLSSSVDQTYTFVSISQGPRVDSYPSRCWNCASRH